jgi:NAD(P)-dependent dehydrogenase (short-subunit alcohol dehydrogenase family)
MTRPHQRPIIFDVAFIAPRREKPMKQVEGKVAFITGGASGIGFGMAQAFLRSGMKVIIADVLQERLDEAAHILAQGTNRDFRVIKVDVTDRAMMAGAAAEAERAFGKVHVLCNNAGVYGNLPIENASYADWDWVLGVNLGGVVNGVVSFLPKMIAHGEGGHIVNTSSMAGIIPLPSAGGLYSTSKFAVRGLTESLRLALGVHNIGVSVLCPGMTRTRIMEAEQHRPGQGAETAAALGRDEWQSTFDMGGGMDPLELGERVLLGIQRNDAYILPHGEFKDEVQGLFDEIISGFPEGQEIDPVRLKFEEVRRQMTAEAKAAIKND